MLLKTDELKLVVTCNVFTSVRRTETAACKEIEGTEFGIEMLIVLSLRFLLP